MNNSIKVGDRFYYRDRNVRVNNSEPKYMIVQSIIQQKGARTFFIRAKYENDAYLNSIHRNYRMLSSDILYNSNLNPDEDDPMWIFEKGENQNGSSIS